METTVELVPVTGDIKAVTEAFVKGIAAGAGFSLGSAAVSTCLSYPPFAILMCLAASAGYGYKVLENRITASKDK